MLILKIAAGESAVRNDGIGDIHVAYLATNDFRVYVNGGTLPDGNEDEHFETMAESFDFAITVAKELTVDFVGIDGSGEGV